MKSMISSKRSLQVENKNETRISGMLGFAMRAGKLIIGTESVCRAMAKGTPKLVLISQSASLGTRKKIRVKCEFYKIPCIELPMDAEKLGKIIGKTYLPMGIAVTDEGFAAEIKKAAIPEIT